MASKNWYVLIYYAKIICWESKIEDPFHEKVCGEHQSHFNFFIKIYVVQLHLCQTAIKGNILTFIDDFSRKLRVLFLIEKS